MYTLYIANRNYSSWSLRPWVLLREAGILFEERLERFVEGPFGSSRERFLRFSPSGQVPCLHDGTIRVWDSLAIVGHVAETHPQVWPEDPAARAFARSAAAEMHSGFGQLRRWCTMSVGIRMRLHEEACRAIAPDLVRLQELWNQGLDRFGGPFLAGPRFSVVDAFYAPIAFRWQSYGFALEGAAADYARHLLALKSMREWERDALAETWRDAAHDAEALESGEIVEDLRARSLPSGA
ncbi:MAG TPA: glutathione S-transferase [Chiayiivirga sp.]|nr:glutathione S-transferase [Chiayiivirga sp.]